MGGEKGAGLGVLAISHRVTDHPELSSAHEPPVWAELSGDLAGEAARVLAGLAEAPRTPAADTGCWPEPPHLAFLHQCSVPPRRGARLQE